MRIGLLAPLLAASSFALACQGGFIVNPSGSKGREVAVSSKKGPPDHAPAHGRRHQRATQPEMRFDSQLSVWVVVGHAELYFSDSRYLRFRDGGWSVSVAAAGPWSPIEVKKLPPGLRKGHHAHKKGKKHAPAKGHW